VIDVTVVIATRNRRDRLAETVCRHIAPVILIDNASDDGTPEYVERRFPSVTVIRLTHNAGAAARNVGVQQARTPFVAFADDDSYWRCGSLDRAAEVLRSHPRTGLLSARVLVGPSARLDPISAAMSDAPLGVPAGHPGPAILGFLSCAAVVRRHAFLQVGGFHPALHVYGEEALLALDLAAAGWNLAYVPSLTVHHLPQPGGRDNWARVRMESRNRLLTALLRRPAGVVARTAAQAVRDPAGRRALLDAGRALPWALQQRRRLPPDVEAACARLDDTSATPSAAAPRLRHDVAATDHANCGYHVSSRRTESDVLPEKRR
jgi:N-acetylglucosaminyl-diphospho-decaprenol L-rhamnosyltransferase